MINLHGEYNKSVEVKMCSLSNIRNHLFWCKTVVLKFMSEKTFQAN